MLNFRNLKASINFSAVKYFNISSLCKLALKAF